MNLVNAENSYRTSHYKKIFPYIAIWQIFYIDVFIDYSLFIALVLFVIGGDAYDVAFLVVCFSLPDLLFGKFIGFLSDNYRYKFTLLFYFICSFFLFLLLLKTYDLPVFLYGIVFLKSMIRSAVNMNFFRSVVEIDGDIYYSFLYSLLSIANNAGKIIGSLVSYLILSRYPYKMLILLSMILQFILFLLVLFHKSYDVIKNKLQFVSQTGEEKKGSVGRRISYIQYFNDVKANKLISITVLSYLVATFSLYISDGLISLLIREYGGSVNQVPLLITIIGIGGAIGSALLSKTTTNNAKTLLAIALYLDAISFTLYGISYFFHSNIRLEMVYFSAFIMGIGMAFNLVSFRTIISKHVPKQINGQFLGITHSFVAFFSIISPLLGGYLIKKISITFPFFVTAIGILIAAVCVNYSLIKKGGKLIYG